MRKLPSDDACVALISDMHMPKNIVLHSLQVNSVAQYLAQFFGVDTELVDKASLLHDLFRVIDIEDWESLHPSPDALSAWKRIKEQYTGTHEEIAFAFFAHMYPVLAVTIREHKFAHVFSLVTMEQKLLTYADKRVKHDQIVSLFERFRDGRVRNSRFLERQDFDANLLEKTEAAYFALEQELFASLPMKPEHVAREVATFIESNKYHDWRARLL